LGAPGLGSVTTGFPLPAALRRPSYKTQKQFLPRQVSSLSGTACHRSSATPAMSSLTPAQPQGPPRFCTSTTGWTVRRGKGTPALSSHRNCYSPVDTEAARWCFQSRFPSLLDMEALPRGRSHGFSPPCHLWRTSISHTRRGSYLADGKQDTAAGKRGAHLQHATV